MAINKPEQASTEMTKVLKSIADTIDGKSNTDCAATSEISKWTKYVGNKLAENGGTEIIPLVLEATLMDMNMNDVPKSQFLGYLNDTSKIVTLNNSIVQRQFENGVLITAGCVSSSIMNINDGIKLICLVLSYYSPTLSLERVEVVLKNGGVLTKTTTPIELS